MNRVTITLTIDLPDGVVPDVEYGNPANARQPFITETVPTEPPHVAEFPPLAEAPRYDRDEVAVGNVQKDQAPPFCPTHRTPMAFRPAGVSKRTGKTYRAFWGCTDRDCKQTQDAAA